MDLVRPAGDDEDGNVTRVKDLSVENVDISDIEDLSVKHESVGGVLLVQCGVNVELGLGQPGLQGLAVSLDVAVENLGKDVLAKLTEELLKLEVGVDLTHLADNHGGLVLREESGEAVGDVTTKLDDGVLGLLEGLAGGEDLLHGRVGVAELSPALLPLGILVKSNVDSRTNMCQ